MPVPEKFLLAADEAPPATLARPQGKSPFILVCDHASHCVPRRLAQLGLPAAELQRHIGWDIGTAGLTRALGETLDAVSIMQNYSRLVIDCNRPLGHPTSIAAISDRTLVPGNQNLSRDAIAARETEIFFPYQNLITEVLDQRQKEQRPAVLLSLHSFTPVFQGTRRDCHIGMLYDRDPRLGRALGDLLRAETDFVIADNEPYALDQTTDFTIPFHGEQRGVMSLEIELRQDLIEDEAGQLFFAGLIARLLPKSLAAASSQAFGLNELGA
jgi:predicted N-formylglutamate amidohydrolase